MTTQQTGPATGEVPRDTWSIRLVIARTQRGLTQQEAADKCGLPRANWSTWESGRIPRQQVDVTQKIAAGLGYDLNWLMFGGPLAGEHDRGPDGGERARQDSNLRPLDYTDEGSGSPADVTDIRERRRNARGTHRWNPLRHKPSQIPAAA